MPFSSAASLPAHIKKRPAKVQRHWRAVWNSTYDACISDGGSEQACEGRAFRAANSVALNFTPDDVHVEQHVKMRRKKRRRGRRNY